MIAHDVSEMFSAIGYRMCSFNVSTQDLHVDKEQKLSRDKQDTMDNSILYSHANVFYTATATKTES
jgi:hypothetical protein